MISRCETCTYWNPVVYPYEQARSDTTNNPEPGSWGYCVLIGDPSRDRLNRRDDSDITSPRAFTRDGSDYWSALITRSDFGCTEHQETA